MSKRSSILSSPVFSTGKEGWNRIPETKNSKMGNPNDATINIPLSDVSPNSGIRAQDPIKSPMDSNEKTSLFKRHAGFRHRGPKGNDVRGANNEDEDTLTQMGKIYSKFLNFSIVTRYFLFVAPLAIIIAVPIVIGATVTKNAKIGPEGGVRIVWVFTWVEIVWLSLWVSKLFAKSLPWLFQFLCGIVSSGTRKYALVLKSLEIPISIAGWALAAFATFQPLMTHNPDQRHSKDTTAKNWESLVSKVLAAFLISSLLLLGEKLIIQLISISYHRKQFDLKIKDSKHNIYLLSLLYDASREMFPAYCPEFAEEDYLINDSINFTLSKSASGHARSGSATPMRLLQNVGRIGDKVTAAFGNIAHEVTGKAVFNPTAAHSIVVEALEKNTSSEALARRIWMSFVVEGKDALYQEDIIEVLSPERQHEAEECFASLDRDGNGDISLDEMILTVCDFGRERKSIASSLHDVDQAIHVLDNLLCTVVFVMTIFVFIAFLNASFTTTLATTGTALLSLSFVFAATAQEFLGSCIFLFVKHPFDVGDRVDIGNDQLVVEHISLLFTVFKRINCHKTTQVPNIVLNTVWIDNISRSKAMREQLTINIHFDTTLDDVQLLRNEMQKFVLHKENSRDFQPDIEVEVAGIGAMNQLELRVEIKHKSNWSNEAVRAARRSKFMCALVLALRKVPIYAPGGGSAALGSVDAPTYSVSVSDREAAANRAAFDKAKSEKRMVPMAKPPSDSSSTASTSVDPETQQSGTTSTLRNRSPSVNKEQNALNSLNARHPATDPAHDWETEASFTTNAFTNAADGAEALCRNDLEEVRGMLRRQSTRGKRSRGESARSNLSPSTSTNDGIQAMSNPLKSKPQVNAVPTIRETSAANNGVAYQDYGAPQSLGTTQPSMQGRAEADGGYNPYQQAQKRPANPAFTALPRMPAAGLQVQPRPGTSGSDRNNSFA